MKEKKKEHEFHSWDEVRWLVRLNKKLAEHPLLKEKLDLLIDKGEKILEGPNDSFCQIEITQIKDELLDSLQSIETKKTKTQLRKSA